MSYFDDQFDAWMDNDCKGTIEETDPFSEPLEDCKGEHFIGSEELKAHFSRSEVKE